MKLITRLFRALLVVFLVLAGLWAVGAIYFDAPLGTAKRPVAIMFGLTMLGFLLFGRRWRFGIPLLLFAVVLGWWWTLQPSNERNWQPDAAQTPWAEINGDVVTIHNVRNCNYRTETDYDARWETRTVKLSSLTGIDMAITYWGSPYMAHPIVSFQFSDALPICFSIETRKEVGESYSAIGGIYRQYELLYICADERDVIRLRSNFRKGEDVYLYRMQLTPEQARTRFLEYIESSNQLRAKPRWYNAVTTNCTTTIRTQHDPTKRAMWDWRMLVNGFADEMLYERGAFVKTLPFSELKAKSLINPKAQAAGDSPDFSRWIREGIPGFDAAVAQKAPVP